MRSRSSVREGPKQSIDFSIFRYSTPLKKTRSVVFYWLPTFLSSLQAMYSHSSSLALRGDDASCNPGGGADTYFGLRIASVFIILVGSLFGAGFPVLAARYNTIIKVPHAMFEQVFFSTLTNPEFMLMKISMKVC